MTETTEKTYQVLARKYRPETFADLVGQDAMVRTLKNAFAADRIAQAFIMTGIRGTGKTTTARSPQPSQPSGARWRHGKRAGAILTEAGTCGAATVMHGRTPAPRTLRDGRMAGWRRAAVVADPDAPGAERSARRPIPAARVMIDRACRAWRVRALPSTTRRVPGRRGR